MQSMNETQIHQEGDEVTDRPSFSIMAIVGLLCSLIGIFSIGYVQILPVAILGTLIGAVTLIMANRFRLNFLSKALAALAIMVGAVSASWGVSERWLETAGDVEQARKIAELYLESLSSKDLDKVYYLVGFQFEGESNEEREGKKPNELSRAKLRLEQDAAHMEIRNRKTPAKWVFLGLDSEISGSLGHTYRLKYRDEGQTIPPEYWIYARKDCMKFDVKEKVQWVIDNLEHVKK